MWLLGCCQEMGRGIWITREPRRSGGLPWLGVWLPASLTDNEVTLLFWPQNSSPSPGLPSAGGIPVAQLLFSKTHPRSHLHGQLGWQKHRGVGWSGTAEVFQGRGTPAGSHIKERWQPPGLILAPTLGHQHRQLQCSFYSCGLKWNWQFPLQQDDKLENGGKAVGEGQPGVS